MTESSMERRGIARFGWILHAVVTGMVALSGLYLLTIPDERNIGVLSMGFALLGVLLSVSAFRKGEDYAWTVMWVYPATFGALAISLILGNEIGVGGYYLGLAVLGSLAQLTHVRRSKANG